MADVASPSESRADLRAKLEQLDSRMDLISQRWVRLDTTPEQSKQFQEQVEQRKAHQASAKKIEDSLRATIVSLRSQNASMRKELLSLKEQIKFGQLALEREKKAHVDDQNSSKQQADTFAKQLVEEKKESERLLKELTIVKAEFAKARQELKAMKAANADGSTNSGQSTSISSEIHTKSHSRSHSSSRSRSRNSSKSTSKSSSASTNSTSASTTETSASSSDTSSRSKKPSSRSKSSAPGKGKKASSPRGASSRSGKGKKTRKPAHSRSKSASSKEDSQSIEVEAKIESPAVGEKTAEVKILPNGRRDYKGETQLELRENMGDNILDYDDLYFIKALGTGVSSKVYKGTWKKDQTVAIKVMKVDTKEKDLKDFRKELYVMNKVDSPFIVKLYGMTLAPKLCVVMEYMANGTLFHYMQSDDKEMAWPLFFSWATQITQGVHTLHTFETPIVHRDLKPLNLLISDEMTIKVCDFGLSRFTDENQKTEEMQTLTKLRGTYAYTAPEIYKKVQYSNKSDVYSIAVILWEMATRIVGGKYVRPFSEYSEIRYDYQIIFQTATHQKRPTFLRGTPTPVRQVISKTWAQDPDARPDGGELLQGIEMMEANFKKNPSKWAPKA
eukprot:TRINITY_DN1652_c0_g1_i2.p1 TRINITY_DN1652_c0_g1~~TRINITY_DN1652_c0_g1_i2.p1  ORF type:complete len:631 (+),score=151.83 TRINITY_DN1652_c0_g1_i2:46-1893(+)